MQIITNFVTSIVNPIVLSDTRSPDVFLFLTWQNDTSGSVGCGDLKAVCEDAQTIQIVEAWTDDSYSGRVIILKFLQISLKCMRKKYTLFSLLVDI